MQPKTQKTEELEATFNELAEVWYREASYWSFSSQSLAHCLHENRQLGESGSAADFPRTGDQRQY